MQPFQNDKRTIRRSNKLEHIKPYKMSESDNSSWESEKSDYSSESLEDNDTIWNEDEDETEKPESSEEEEDYEEEQRKPTQIHNNSLKNFNIDIDIKTVITKKLNKI